MELPQLQLDQAIRRRDAGLGRIKDWTRSAAVAGVAMTGLFAVVAARATPVVHQRASTPAPASSTATGQGHQDQDGGNDDGATRSTVPTPAAQPTTTTPTTTPPPPVVTNTGGS